MALFGMWHGAGLQFVGWGAYHGALLVGHRLLRPRPVQAARDPASAVASWMITFALVSLGWVLFTADSLVDGARILRAVLTPGGYFHGTFPPITYLLVLGVGASYLACVGAHELLGRARSSGAVSAAVPTT
jgi:alginate O-acetyltransferase complex protein AlgI